MSGGGDRVANGEQVRAKRSGGQGQWKFGNRVTQGRVVAGAMKLPLQVLLRDLNVTHSHADVIVTQHLHKSWQANTEAQHGGREGMTKTVWSHLWSAGVLPATITQQRGGGCSKKTPRGRASDQLERCMSMSPNIRTSRVGQFERSLIAERVKARLANARAKGTVLGMPLRARSRDERAPSKIG